jgi:predicted ATPase
VLVLDNCEHVAAGCRALLGQLVADCVDLRVITTSRVPLGLSCERIYGVPALGSGTDEGGEPTDAMALFVDRAAGVASGYALTELNRPVLADICRTLQGSPLAIELAASWIRVLSPRDLLSSLARVGPVVGSDSAGFVEERHRSIEAVLDGSWRWLGKTDRAVIEALGVFVGGFTKLESPLSVESTTVVRRRTGRRKKYYQFTALQLPPPLRRSQRKLPTSASARKPKTRCHRPSSVAQFR